MLNIGRCAGHQKYHSDKKALPNMFASSFLKDYISTVEAAVNSDKTTSLSNPDRAHARVLIAELLKAAQDEVVILCHKLALDVYGSDLVCRALDEAYRKNPNLKCTVFVREKSPQFSPFVSTLLSHNAKIITSFDPKDKGDIFIVDKKHGRQETNPGQRTATAHFNNYDWAAKAVGDLKLA